MTQFVRDAAGTGNPALWSSGLDHCTVLLAPWTTSEIKDHILTPFLVFVLERKVSGKRYYYRFLRGCGEEEY